MDDDASKTCGAAPTFVETADLLHLGTAYRVVTTPDGRRRFLQIGALAREMMGLDPAEGLTDPERLYAQVVPEHRGALERAEAAAIATLSRFDVEVRMRGRDGELRWRRITSTPTPQADGSVVWDGIVMDVNDARRAAEVLSEQRRRLEAAVEATGLGFWEWDVPGDRVTWSERNCEMFGLPRRKTTMTIEAYGELVHPDDRELVRDIYERTRDHGGGDFVVEHRTTHQPGRLPRWVQAQGRIVKGDDGVRLVVGTTLDISDRKAAEDRRALLMGELAHRAKNGIQVMMGLVVQTARSAKDVGQFEEVLLARLQAMADSQDLVMASGGRPVPLSDVVAKSLTPFGAARFEQDELGGVMVAGDVAVPLALLLHELSTNAVKYGALSSASGRVLLRRGKAVEGHAELCWRECDGPEVKPRTRKGFGSRLIEVGLAAQGGRVEASFEPTGFSAQICFPVAQPPRT